MKTSRPERLYSILGRAHTLSGSDIFLNETNRQNHFRSQLSELSWAIVSSLERHGLSEALLADTVSKLRSAKDDPQHYGDNRPGKFFEDHTPIVPDPRFSYWNLLGYGITGEGGYNEFLKITGIDHSIDYATLCGVIGLLLIESSVLHLNVDDFPIASSDAMEAATCVEEMMLDRRYRSILKESRQEMARKGGIAAHAKTADMKAKIVSEWKSGRFNNKKRDAVTWALREFPQWKPKGAKDLVRRWLRESDKATSTTQQDQ